MGTRPSIQAPPWNRSAGRTFVLILACSLIPTRIARAADPPPIAADPKLLREGGDCLDDEILAWQRLRAERRTVVDEDDSAPIACAGDGGRVFLATASGKLLVSQDAGRNFDPPRRILVDDRPVEHLRAFGVLRNSSRGWQWLGKPPSPLLIAHSRNGRLEVARSGDDGATWRAIGSVTADGPPGEETGAARMVHLSDGRLLLPISIARVRGADPEGVVFSSTDEGKTWAPIGSLGPRCAAASLIELRSGEMLAAMTCGGQRGQGDRDAPAVREPLSDQIVVARSLDGGRTWGDSRCVTRCRESPADLTELSDGTVVLTYGQRNFPYGARAIASSDGGRTWNPRVYILGFSTVQLTWSSSPKLTAPGWLVSSLTPDANTILSFYTRGSLVVSRDYVLGLGHEPGQAKQLEEEGAFGDRGKAILSVRWSPSGLPRGPLSYPGVLGTPDAEGYLNNGRVQIKPELLNWGGDYFSHDEILVYSRLPAEHHRVGPGAGATLALDRDGHPVLCTGNGRIYRSGDEGRTWTAIGAAPDAGWVSSFGILRDGALIAIIGIDVYRSEDSGKTWMAPRRLERPGYFDVMGPDECQRVNQLPDGTVLVTVCGGNSRAPGMRGAEPSMVYRSPDGGRTWKDWDFGGGHNLLRLRSGRLVAAFRHEREWAPDDLIVREDIPQNKYRTMLYRVISFLSSDDGGRRWSIPRTITRYNETPGDLAELDDGTIVLTYHNKNNVTGARAMTSRDGGKTWDRTLYMLGWWTASGGFTSSVLLRDGRVLTADNGWSPGDNSMVTEVTIWKPLDSAKDAPAAGAPEGKRLGWIFNNDTSSCWEALSGGESTHEEYKNIIRQMLDTRPGLFAQCVGCIDPVVYPSEVATWGEKAEEYDLEVRRKANTDDVNPGDSAEQRKRARILRRFREPGKDPLTLAIEVCRARKVPIVVSFRMADGGSYHASPLRSEFSRRHPDWTIGKALPNGATSVPGLGEMLGGQGGWGMDRAIPEVYAHQIAIFKEAIERFDVDGIEFDFKRYYPMISNPHTNFPVHTRLMREMREFLDGHAKRKGRGRMLLGARVSYSIERPMDPRLGVPGVDFHCKDLGLDVETWIREGYVDYICPSYFHGRDLPGLPNTREFAELAKGTWVGVYPSTFARPRWPEKERHPDSEASWRRFRDEICADALQMYADGADGVSTYNMNPGDYSNPLVYPPPRTWTPGESFRRGSAAYNRIVAAVMARLGSAQALREFMGQDLAFMKE